jgi:hypothetical protein
VTDSTLKAELVYTKPGDLIPRFRGEDEGPCRVGHPGLARLDEASQLCVACWRFAVLLPWVLAWHA